MLKTLNTPLSGTGGIEGKGGTTEMKPELGEEKIDSQFNLLLQSRQCLIFSAQPIPLRMARPVGGFILTGGQVYYKNDSRIVIPNFSNLF